MIASNKQKQEHNNFATFQRPKLKGVHECSQSLDFVNFTKNANANPHKNGQDSHWGLLLYHMTTMNENMNYMKLTHLLSTFL